MNKVAEETGLDNLTGQVQEKRDEVMAIRKRLQRAVVWVQSTDEEVVRATVHVRPRIWPEL